MLWPHADWKMNDEIFLRIPYFCLTRSGEKIVTHWFWHKGGVSWHHDCGVRVRMISRDVTASVHLFLFHYFFHQLKHLSTELALCSGIVMGHAWTSWVWIVYTQWVSTSNCLGFTTFPLYKCTTNDSNGICIVGFNFRDQGSLFVNNVPDSISNSNVDSYPCSLS